MADRRLILHGTPPLTFYQGARPAGDLQWPRLAGFPEVRQALRVAGGEAGNASVDLDNGDGTLTEELVAVPLRTEASVWEDGEEVFRGLLVGVGLGPTATLDLEEGGARRYADLAPLRTTAALGAFAETRGLPQVYGVVTLEPIPMDGTGKLWLLADHAIAGVESATSGDQALGAWTWRNAADQGGHPIALLETVSDLSKAPPAVTLRGKADPTTGALLERPDAVLYDWLVRVCGMPLTAADFDALRSAAPGITLAAVLSDHTATVQTLTDYLCQGAGLAWSPSTPGVAMLWPQDPQGTAWPDRRITLAQSPRLRAAASQDDLCTVLELAYAYDWAAEDFTRTLTLRAPAAVQQYGEIRRRVEAPTLRAPADALAFGTRYLQHHARPAWTVTASRPRIAVAPGESVAIAHPSSPITLGVVTALVRRPEGDTLTLVAATGSAPAVELVEAAEST